MLNMVMTADTNKQAQPRQSNCIVLVAGMPGILSRKILVLCKGRDVTIAAESFAA